MVLALVGAVFAALGLFAGAVLVVAPLGLATVSPGPALWVLFPLFSIGGFTLIAMGVRTSAFRGLLVVLSCVLLALALASAAGLVLGAASLLQLASSTLSLWYVLFIAGTLGALGVASHAKSAAGAA